MKQYKNSSGDYSFIIASLLLSLILGNTMCHNILSIILLKQSARVVSSAICNKNSSDEITNLSALTCLLDYTIAAQIEVISSRQNYFIVAGFYFRKIAKHSIASLLAFNN